ncbi:MAG: hydroxyacylglutathione hydrolase [Lysobacterales bacterium]|jgi:hydroxyacylglutathione hydrolase|nr:MAG: hydroxyacylglutathione hydrolase [Xanthomonadales bacterium]
MLEVSPVRAFSDNYLWLIRAPADRSCAVVVDPGDAAPVERELEHQGLSLRAVLVTHHHPDHVGGVQALAARHDAPVYGPARERVPCEYEPLEDGDVVDLADLALEFRVLDVPGHTAGHIAYAGHGAVFCGDTLFSAGCGRLFEGTPSQMLDSLDRLAALPDETLVYCAHEYTLSNLRFAAAVEPGNGVVLEALEEVRALRERDAVTLPSTIGRERGINPFLRCREPTVRGAAERHAGRTLDRPADVFAVIRSWKDGFR